MKHLTLHEEFAGEGKKPMVIMPEDQVISILIKKFGNPPSISDVASWCYNNYSKITGLPTKDRNDEGYFPEQIENIIDKFGFSLDDFSQEWGTLGEGIEEKGKAHMFADYPRDQARKDANPNQMWNSAKMRLDFQKELNAVIKNYIKKLDPEVIHDTLEIAYQQSKNNI